MRACRELQRVSATRSPPAAGRLKNSRGVLNKFLVFFCLSFLGFCRICVQCLLQGRISKRDAYGFADHAFRFGHPDTGSYPRHYHGFLSLSVTRIDDVDGDGRSSSHFWRYSTWELNAKVIGLGFSLSTGTIDFVLLYVV